jgi:hypothetical protein
MKSNILSACRRNVRSAVALAALLGLAGFTVAAQQYASPVGTWDCLISGSGQQGIAFLTFNPAVTNHNQGTFSGYQLVSQKKQTTSSNDGGRNPGGDVGRYVTIDTNAPFNGGTNLLGFTPVNGPWWYDEKGRVVGYFTVAGGFHEPVTNYIPVYDSTGTNLLYERTEIDIGGFTNAFSYVAKVVTGKRLTLSCSTTTGKVTYKGVPYKTTIPGISGRWSGTKKENHQEFLQEFNLTSVALGNPFDPVTVSDDVTNFANIYFSTNGTGPGYLFDAAAMVSTQKKIGFNFFTFPEGATNVTILGTKQGVTFGPVTRNNKVTKANTTGMEQPDPGTPLSVPMTFQGALQRGP